MESIKKRARDAGRWLAEQWRRLASAAGDVLRSKEQRMRVGYYVSLALLLTLLGLGSYAWRARGQSGGDVPEEPPREAIAMQVPTLAPIPEPTPEPARWALPLEGEVTGTYSPEAPVWSETLGQWQTHPGLDIAGSPGEAVYACGDGTVAGAWSDRLWGNVVVIEHDEGYRSTYAGLNTLELVQEGDAVRLGQVVGSVGRSATCEAELGWHLHFELARDGVPVDFEALLAEQP